ncbi:NACHT domain-containing protein [Peribacillus frigoritolerans]|uniref:NACHT domain-containing protein n=1 Tax=Peribacillus frigoritolerans TaxID=450367 RepID=A0AAJ1VC58_9BACI|nr:NACHT domain-containing protein [Peribacillus frigoritolerans]MDM5281923.1 NACHT domain-containing protein [Peribacillus frigoritolerans]
MDFSSRMSIPRIECSNLTSSGFLVSNDKVITALHAIKPYLHKEVKAIKVIFINEQGVETVFNAVPLLDVDGWEEYEIICLQLNQQVENFKIIKCIDYRFYSTTECLTYGYPAVAKEKGTSIDLEIRNEYKDVDIDYGSNLDIKVKSDSIKDYSGCSGGPLLYNNQAVAVMLEQVSESKEASRLCAVSLYIYREYLNLIGVPLITKKHESDYEEYILSLKHTLQQQLENNLKRNIEENKVNPLGFSISVQPKNSAKEDISFNKILEDDQSVMILSKPGGGKTYLLQMLMLEIIENPQISIGKIPIYLKAKEWYRGYENIVKGLRKELEYYSPDINDEQIIEDLKEGKYILLLDGLDELINDKDLFIREIRRLSQFKKTKIIMTCRQQNYHNEFHKVLTEYNLKALSDTQIQEYIEAVFGESVHYGFIHELKKQLNDLIENPLFLYMTAHIMKEMTSKVIPKNKSELYEMFISYIMQERLLKDGTYLEMAFEFDVKEEILMEFAYLNFREKNNSVKLRDVICSRIGQENLNLIKKEILQTGVLLEERNRIEFFHPSIEEYFVALKLSRFPEDEIMNFVEINYLSEVYYEVFKFTSGLLRNYEQQNLILDKLETKDIYLYRQCLESRFNFNNRLDEIWSKDYLEEYFAQMRRSYLNIIDNFFGNIKREFYPWCEGEDLCSNDKVAIVGALNRARLTLSIEILRNDIDERTIIVSEEAGSATLESRDEKGNVISTPIISFQSSNHWYFDLQQTDFGLDSAREFALYVVKNQLKELLKKQRLFNYESPESIVPCIEYVLKSLPSQYFSVRESNGELNRVSLSKHPSQLILKVLLYEDNIFKYVQSKGSYGRLSNEFVSGVLLKFFKLIDEKIEFGEYLLLQSDIKPNKNTYSSWDLWSEERIKERLKQFFKFYQKAYRTLVEQCFISIHGHMRLYAAGPVRFELGFEKYEDRYSGISIEWLPVETLEETIPVFKEEQRKWFGDEGFETTLAKIDQELLRLNRKLVGGHTLQSSALDSYLFDDIKLRDMVYEEIKQELKYVLGELK